MIVVLTISVASGIFEGQPFFGTMGFYLEHDIGLLLQKKAQRKTLSKFAHKYMYYSSRLSPILNGGWWEF